MRLKNFFQLLATALVTSVLLIGCKSGFNENLNSNKESIANQDTVQPITLDMVSINSNKRTVALGESLKLYATAYFSDNKHETVTELVEWSIEGDKNISIDKMTGEVTTLREGVAVVSAYLDGMESKTISIEVTAPELTDIAVTVQQKSLPVGISTQLYTWGLFTDGQWRRVMNGIKWENSKEDIIQIDDEGNVFAIKEGITNIVADVDGLLSPPIMIEVTKAKLAVIDIIPQKLSLPLGTTQSIFAMGTFTDGKTIDITEDVEWLGSRTDITRIENKKIIATKLGVNTVVAKMGNIHSNPVEIAVTDAIVSHLQLTPIDVTLAKGTTVEFHAKSIYTDGSEEDVTNKVTWQSDNYDVVTFVDNKATGHKQAKVRVSASLSSGESASVDVTVTDAELSQIEITPAALELELAQVGQLYVIGKYSDGSEANITDQVSWESSNSNFVSLMHNGLLNALEVGTSTVTARLQGTTQSVKVIVKEKINIQDKITMCGGKIDDDSLTTAQGNCLKVASDKYGNLFSGAPSIKLLNSLGYKLVKYNQKPQANTKSYNNIKVERFGYGPAGEAFGLFNNNGLTGQNEQWCNELSAKNFAGRNNWRRATRAELMGLYSKVGGSLWDGSNDHGVDSRGLGWPVTTEYWSALNMDQVSSDGYYDIVNMHVGRSFLISRGDEFSYPSCIAPISR
ncbi:Ig-like domain-containing protein [Vibrio cholerae]|uniref:Ig-like domain-containing protein n=1 Tax=Vibrio cholerae TaxID=666 RepID=UPI0033097F87|nr:Ig-like domain-containing protein [Vibrio cholerae]